MFAHDHASGRNHRRLLQRIRVMPHIPRQKRRTDRGAIHAIAIGFGARRLAGVKLGRGLGHLQHAYRRRQNVVQGARPIFSRNRGRSTETGRLGQRVHARVGAAGALRQHMFPAQACNRRGQRALHGRPSGLHLPAEEVRAIVRKDEFEIAHVLFRVLSCPRIAIGIYTVLPLPWRNARRRVSYTSLLTIDFANDRYYLRSVKKFAFPQHGKAKTAWKRMQGTLGGGCTYVQSVGGSAHCHVRSF